ncbi:Demethylmenaquinone methyltransferase [Aliarcobacter thereius]|uniref:Demethylmenaquinone methyltransferase n=2 Tax=Aliarcobacter thereius TaxID=544718 RepID=A0A1C0B7Z9_9BACT|nr:bifunctional demethylmenaquinone methyltransferase/2-methoxy-6-polyprenyl-1,4-benzoquinol methylase UbiE [Aliarcobacter thereius]OCL87742.1 Demethylmenaquinone methyltransferase [Aliarcobacter thereius]OCL95393.1 Demethylmenaquinone methyltransferase [Aliarcobacter thereius LMG 24486]OCL99714.1 Demethylmenaquinone methyltransferase [Aliarcobacter thereius]QBF16619.1 bifunctional 2-octaprenyl-6-methoxy-1,4-benzoquinone methylase / S-adenosylmethionine:2-DMK methyltransferase [Aliarcobacter th
MEKQEKIVSMFNNIAPTYDKANRVMSMGIDKSWRDKACNKTFELYNRKSIEKVVDVACGTGDMILFWKQNAKKRDIILENIVGIDPSVGMMEVGKTKLPEVEFIEAYATKMPLENDSSDILSISYGIRNVVQRQEAFYEFARVLKKGGLVVISEFTKNNKKSFLDKLTAFYMDNILPIIGGLISKNKEAYRYLPDSIDEFLTTENLCKELEIAGFEIVYTKAFSMKISTLIIAKKI